eukprot:gene33318-38703_t
MGLLNGVFQNFGRLLAVWEQGRQKNERLLRPRLGSPDALDALLALDSQEKERSQDFTDCLSKFRSQLLRAQVARMKLFLEDLCCVYRGFMTLLDATLTQSNLHVPPDTAVPKKHLTLKKLRKTQRRKEEVEAGQADTSHHRVWPGLNMDRVGQVYKLAE